MLTQSDAPGLGGGTGMENPLLPVYGLSKQGWYRWEKYWSGSQKVSD